MKKVAIGSVLTVCGTIINCLIIVAASIQFGSVHSWRGSKFWYVIFGDFPYKDNLSQSMDMGVPFILGLLLLLCGIIILAIEYFRKDS